MTDTHRPVREYPFSAPDRLHLDPFNAQLRRTEPLTRVRLPSGEEAWLATRHADMRIVLGDPRFSRAASVGRDDPAGQRMVLAHQRARAGCGLVQPDQRGWFEQVVLAPLEELLPAPPLSGAYELVLAHLVIDWSVRTNRGWALVLAPPATRGLSS